jgi:RNA polymerase sigma-70 factor (ECF subfamily)
MAHEACEAAVEARQGEAALVARARRGDGLAFEQLHAKYRNRLFTLCLNLCGEREEASDLLQETFLRAWRGLRGFGGRSEFSTWLYQIALNVCRDAGRRRRRAPARPSIPPGRDAAAVARVREALGRLREPYRVALVLRYGQALSYQEIADQLRWTLPKVKMTLHRAKLAFREAYLQTEESQW